MEYFVSAENLPFYQWQLELLIESFKKQNCQDKLLVSLAYCENPVQSLFWKNLINHPRIYNHENIGQIRGYRALNQIYSLVWALSSEQIKQPFVFLQPDTVLRHEIKSKFINDVPEIYFSPDMFFTIDEAEERVGPFWEWCEKKKSDFDNNWASIGSVMIFKQIPIVVFQRVLVICELLAMKQLEENKLIWKHTDRLAWAIVLNEYRNDILIIGDYKLTSTMLGNDNAPIIDYQHGLPPFFNKQMFPFSPPNYSSLGDPFNILAENAPTANSHYISELAQANLKSRKI